MIDSGVDSCENFLTFVIALSIITSQILFKKNLHKTEYYYSQNSSFLLF